MFRHALAQALVDGAGLEVAQEVLGHAHQTTTAASYAQVSEQTVVRALDRVRDLFLRAREAGRPQPPAAGYVFPYDPATASELEAAASEPGQRR